ncbi:MAG: hypothetical protein JSV61_14670 [Anaerolineales bacterium]|nr:MAG: hypothetical protein JSV61_14670 [Anaerolineales bacterium]
MIVNNRIFSFASAITLILGCLLYPNLQANSATPLPQPETIGDAASIQESTNSQDYNSCGGQYAPLIDASFENEVVVLVNKERESRNLPPLKEIAGLTEAARYHATDLGQDDYFDHNSYDRINGNLVYICSTWNRIDAFYSGGKGENIAAGYTTPASVMSAWMNSTGHRNNILSTNHWEIGVGYYQGSGTYSRYWVQDFGKSSGVYPLIINNDAAKTDNKTVSLYTYGTNWQEMRFRNNNEPWSNWMTFSNKTTWQLPNYSGEHTVYSELRYGSLVVSNSDKIRLELPDQPALGNLPQQVTFNYNLQAQSFSPAAIILTPQNVGNEQVLNWTVTKQGDWFIVSPSSGSTPNTFEVIPNIPNNPSQQIYTGSLTVTVTSPQAVAGSPFTVNLELILSNSSVYKTYLPLSIVAQP